jgi:AAA+ ATPase superfamily predicted ATPase
MKNPFIYGEIVTGTDFCDRENELKELIRDMQSGERVFLISPRRYGKSSLIGRVIEQMKAQGYLVAFIDLFKVSSLNHFLEIYVQSITKAAETTLSGYTKFIRDFLKGIRPKIVIDSRGKPCVEIGFHMIKDEILSYLPEIYDLPQQIAQKRKKNFIVIFDEFQELSSLDGERLEKSMRASMQNQPLVSYLFSGSRKHIMYDMVSDRNRAFYKMARIMSLGKLPEPVFSSYLKNKFVNSGYALDDDVIHSILKDCKDYPYNAQFICHKIWDMKSENKKVHYSDISEAIEEILKDLHQTYLTLWDNLSNHQKRLLEGIAKFGGKSIQSSEFIRSADLTASSSVQTSKKILINKDIIDKENGEYFFTDVFFREWISRKILS